MCATLATLAGLSMAQAVSLDPEAGEAAAGGLPRPEPPAEARLESSGHLTPPGYLTYPAYPAHPVYPAAPSGPADMARPDRGESVGLPGMASVYHRRLHGRPTASGEPYINEGWTAAHRHLPLGTLLSVRNPANGVEVVVRVNDRGPFHAGRIVDLSVAAGQALGLMRVGVAMVVIRPLLSGEAAGRRLGVQDARW